MHSTTSSRERMVKLATNINTFCTEVDSSDQDSDGLAESHLAATHPAATHPAALHPAASHPASPNLTPEERKNKRIMENRAFAARSPEKRLKQVEQISELELACKEKDGRLSELGFTVKEKDAIISIQKEKISGMDSEILFLRAQLVEKDKQIEHQNLFQRNLASDVSDIKTIMVNTFKGGQTSNPPATAQNSPPAH